MAEELIPCEDVNVQAGMTKYHTVRGESLDELMFHLLMNGTKISEISISQAA